MRGLTVASVRCFHCSFCGKHKSEVKKLIAGPLVWICDECVELCNDIIIHEKDDPTAAPPIEFGSNALSELIQSLKSMELLVSQVAQGWDMKDRLRDQADELSGRIRTLQLSTLLNDVGQ